MMEGAGWCQIKAGMKVQEGGKCGMVVGAGWWKMQDDRRCRMVGGAGGWRLRWQVLIRILSDTAHLAARPSLPGCNTSFLNTP